MPAFPTSFHPTPRVYGGAGTRQTSLKSVKQGGIITASLLLLCGMLYGILSSEDNALLMGTLLIFGVLSLDMIVMRRIDWYAVMDGMARLNAKNAKNRVVEEIPSTLDAGVRRHDENAARRRPQQHVNMRQTYPVLLVSCPYSARLQSA
jgi:hypothetical protein